MLYATTGRDDAWAADAAAVAPTPASSIPAAKRANARQRQAIDQANQRARHAEQSARRAQRAANRAANRPAPAPVVVVPAAPAAPSTGLTDCGTGTQDEAVFANADTSCPFALNVESDYWNAPGMTFTSYSPVTDQDYAMSATDDGTTVTVTGGTDSLVEFGHGDLGR